MSLSRQPKQRAVLKLYYAQIRSRTSQQIVKERHMYSGDEGETHDIRDDMTPELGSVEIES